MAIIMQNPDNVPGAVSTGYQLQNDLIYAGNTGFCNVHFSDDYSTITSGSVFELNGKLIKCTATENVADIDFIALNSYFYIYAVMGTTDISLLASVTVPVWDTGKCGFYNGNNRALVKVAKTESGKFVQVNFDTDFNNSYLIIPANFSTPVKEINWEATEYITLDAGWYQVTAAGAGGGALPAIYNFYGLGGDGGFISKIFFIPYGFINAKLTVGKAGINEYHFTGGAASGDVIEATAGGKTIFESPEFGISLIAYGGEKGERGFAFHGQGDSGGNNLNLNIGGGSKGSNVLSNGGGNAEPGKISIYKF